MSRSRPPRAEAARAGGAAAALGAALHLLAGEQRDGARVHLPAAPARHAGAGHLQAAVLPQRPPAARRQVVSTLPPHYK